MMPTEEAPQGGARTLFPEDRGPLEAIQRVFTENKPVLEALPKDQVSAVVSGLAKEVRGMAMVVKGGDYDIPFEIIDFGMDATGRLTADIVIKEHGFPEIIAKIFEDSEEAIVWGGEKGNSRYVLSLKGVIVEDGGFKDPRLEMMQRVKEKLAANDITEASLKGLEVGSTRVDRRGRRAIILDLKTHPLSTALCEMIDEVQAVTRPVWRGYHCLDRVKGKFVVSNRIEESPEAILDDIIALFEKYPVLRKAIERWESLPYADSNILLEVLGVEDPQQMDKYLESLRGISSSMEMGNKSVRDPGKRYELLCEIETSMLEAMQKLELPEEIDGWNVTTLPIDPTFKSGELSEGINYGCRQAIGCVVLQKDDKTCPITYTVRASEFRKKVVRFGITKCVVPNDLSTLKAIEIVLKALKDAIRLKVNEKYWTKELENLMRSFKNSEYAELIRASELPLRDKLDRAKDITKLEALPSDDIATESFEDGYAMGEKRGEKIEDITGLVQSTLEGADGVKIVSIEQDDPMPIKGWSGAGKKTFPGEKHAGQIEVKVGVSDGEGIELLYRIEWDLTISPVAVQAGHVAEFNKRFSLRIVDGNERSLENLGGKLQAVGLIRKALEGSIPGVENILRYSFL